MPPALCAATNDLSGLLQKGLFEEEANRNLEAAAQAYSTVSAQFDKDRKLAATAIFRLGEIYRKQGKTNEAAGQYERIVREFADQDTLVTLSRQNIAGMETSAGKLSQKLLPTRPSAGEGTTQESLETELALLRAQLEQARKETNALIVGRLFSIPATEIGLFGELSKEALPKLMAYQELRVRTLESAVLQARAGATTNLTDTGARATATDDEEKEIRRIQAMIQNSPDLINAPSGGVNGDLTPLCVAASKGQLRVVKFLLDNGAAIDGRSSGFNWTALHFAADNGHRAMVELLAERGADINARDYKGETALHLAAGKSYLSVAEALIQRKADFNARSKKESEGVTPLHRAATQGHAEMVALLISKGAEVDARDAHGMTALGRAVMSGHTAILNQLLAAGAKPDIEDENGQTVLLHAAARGNVDSVKALIAAHADPNAGKAGAPLCWAGTLSNPECVKLLLDAGANPNVQKEDGQTPLLAAIERMVDGRAAQYDDSAVLLIQHGANVNLANEKRITPLQMAVWAESIPMVSLLLTNHADVNAPGPAGRNALIMANEAVNSFRPFKPGDYGGSGRVADRDIARKIAVLLRQHGAVDDLPNPDRIEVRRPDARFAKTVFVKGTNDWNQFTLLEAILNAYTDTRTLLPPQPQLLFPNLHRVVVVRPSRTAGQPSSRRIVDLLSPTGDVDCAKDVELEFGDVVEIPERDHTLQESAVGLTGQEAKGMQECCGGKVRLSVRGKNTELKVGPFPSEALIGSILAYPAARSALFSTSDLSKVRVTRVNPASGQLKEWLVDCSGGNNPDLWLRDGDVIEVPDKP